jgi:hypothetical protein
MNKLVGSAVQTGNSASPAMRARAHHAWQRARAAETACLLPR